MAWLLHGQTQWQCGIEHTSDWVQLPVGCVSVRVTVTPEASVRSDPRLACEVWGLYLGANGEPRRGSGVGIPARTEFAIDEEIPVSGHEVGQPPGIVPAVPGSFEFVLRESIGVQQGRQNTQVAVGFRLTLGESVSVSAAIAVEAFDANEQPVEIQ